MWGIIPSAASATRSQPLAFSRELLPIGARRDGDAQRPRAVGESLADRMLQGGADKLCFVISPGQSDLVAHFKGSYGRARICYAVQERPAGFCDALFQPLPWIASDEEVLVGLPGTVWFPENGYSRLGRGLSFLLFRVDEPHLFEAVVTSQDAEVLEVQVRADQPRTRWIWGAFKLDGATLRSLHALWLERDREDEDFGTLVNAYLASGGEAHAVPSGEAYVDTGTLEGYAEAMELLRRHPDSSPDLHQTMH